ncbi:MAG: histidine triad nucleotide-binding protein [Patescibacteria group bacterium]
MTDCIFCKIVKGEIPSKKVYENDRVLVFHDINPVAPVHVLVIPKLHIKSLSGVKEKDRDILGEIQVVTAKAAEKLGISKAFRLVTASGGKAGQEIFHLHYHLVGGWKKSAPKLSVL